jgi:SOS-response transcriptional repressor LexA
MAPLTLAQKIRKARADKKMSVAALARALGVSRPTVDGWEKGAMPRIEHRPDIVKVLGLKLTDFNLYGGGVVLVDQKETKAPVVLLEWSDLRRITDGKTPMAAIPKPKYVEVSSELTTDCYALRVNDDSMEPEFQIGELFFIDPGILPRMHDFVVAQLADGNHVLRRYIYRGDGVFDLQAENARKYSTVTSSPSAPCTIKGVVIEHHKRYRR